MSYVIQSGSKQYIVDEGQQVIVDRIEGEENDTLELQVVYTFGGTPEVTTVTATILKQQRGEKIRVVKYKAKSDYHRQYGYRHSETLLLIGAKPKVTKVAKKTVDALEDSEKEEVAKKVTKTTKKTTATTTK